MSTKKERDLNRWIVAAILGLITAAGLTYWLGLGFWGFIIIFMLATVAVQNMVLKDEAAQVTVDTQDRK
ncbi:MAG: hypothetical protein ACKVOE_04475 [Rickettsiales bacterium]